jgi:hypothetical protein
VIYLLQCIQQSERVICLLQCMQENERVIYLAQCIACRQEPQPGHWPSERICLVFKSTCYKPFVKATSSDLARSWQHIAIFRVLCGYCLCLIVRPAAVKKGLVAPFVTIALLNIEPLAAFICRGNTQDCSAISRYFSHQILTQVVQSSARLR